MKEQVKHNTIWWINGAFVILVHLMAVLFVPFYKPNVAVVIMTVVLWQLAGIGITMGYHRLWSHRTYEATAGLKLLLALLGTLGFQGSIKWWVQRHRLHHRFTDSVDDPYNAKRGFWYSHIGWIFEKPYYRKLRTINIDDLKQDPIVLLQHKYFIQLAFLLGFGMPVFLGYLCGDWFGGFLYGGVVCRLCIWHGTFCINSLAHMIGDQEFTIFKTARGNVFLAFLTAGEGYHNFHHEFPRDYRNGVQWYDYDPTKWMISLASKLKLASNLCTALDDEIAMTRIATMEDKLKLMKEEYTWGPTDTMLPTMSQDELSKLVKEENRWLIIIDGFVCDVEQFMDRHPGGAAILRSFIGIDASRAFNGGLNMHSRTAKLQLQKLKIAKLNI